MGINMIMMVIILLISYSVTYLLVHQSVDNTIERELNRVEGSAKAPTTPRSSNEDIGLAPKNDFLEGLPDKLNFKQEFSVFVSRDTGEIIEIPLLFSYNYSTDYTAMVKEVLLQEHGRGTYKKDGSLWVYKVREDKNKDVLQVTMMEADASLSLLTNLPWIFLVVLLFMLLFIFIVSRFLVNRAVQPILVAFEKQEQFISDASHELKTPVAIMRTNLDAIEMDDQTATIASQEKWLSIIRTETDRMQTLTNRLLYLARMEDENTVREQYPVDFSLLCEESVLSMEAVYFEKMLSTEENIEKDLWVKGDQEEIKQVLYILLENAGKYTPQGGKIEIVLKKVGGKVIFSVKNSGDGLSDDEKERVFDRLYRGDQARERNTGSYGLGLAIAKQIMERHHGSINVESEKGKYTCFSIFFNRVVKEN